MTAEIKPGPNGEGGNMGGKSEGSGSQGSETRRELTVIEGNPKAASMHPLKQADLLRTMKLKTRAVRLRWEGF